ncbi:unnamed protein product [Oppiella nova]|uniref:C2H2-type domain-containing protein n=1 Tax=Oppiella nova TaxID=334625 RepID=A0A7R9MMS0_9ACAR|nr:unnamed protein product [Oppiella nova]CAG2180352.1 unnamed protein product [Oppiella nova]
MCSILVNDILDDLKCDNYRLLNDLMVLREENQRFLNDLCLERQLNHILDNYKNYSLVLINRCKCEISQQLVDQLNRFNDEYNGLKSRRNSVLLSGKNGKYVDTYDEVILPKNTTDDLTDTQICDDCQQVFESEMDLQIHTNSVHKNLQSFSCHECNEVYNTRDLFVIHLTQRHEFRKSGDQMDVKPDMTSSNDTISTVEELTQN